VPRLLSPPGGTPGRAKAGCELLLKETAEIRAGVRTGRDRYRTSVDSAAPSRLNLSPDKARTGGATPARRSNSGIRADLYCRHQRSA
jgi:hypothetical protein